MSKLRHKVGHPKRPSIGYIWEELTEDERSTLLHFVKGYSKHKNAHMGTLTFISVGDIYDALNNPDVFLSNYGRDLFRLVRKILKRAISNARRRGLTYEQRHRR